MADNASSVDAPDSTSTTVSPRDPAGAPVPATRRSASLSRRDVRRIERGARRAAAARVRPLRTVGTVAAVLALLAGVAIPAYAATQPVAQTASVRDAAEDDAQALTVDEGAESAPLAGATYAATTPEEIQEAEAAAAAEEAAARAQEQAEALAAEEQTGSEQSAGTDTEATPTVVDGTVTPLPAGSYYVSRSVSSGHEGADLVAPAMTPIYAVKGGTVITSQEALGGWGVVVAIDHGDGTTTLYGHMTYGSRQVEVGDTVTAGQVIGYVGSTGRSTANHLHIELRINGAIVDPLNYLPI